MNEVQATTCADLAHPEVHVKMAGSLVGERKFSVKQAASSLGVGVTTLRRIVTQGGIPVLRHEGKLIFLERDIEAFLSGIYGTMAKVELTKQRQPSIAERFLDSDVLHQR